MPTLIRPCLLVQTDRTMLSPNWTLAQAIAPAVTGGASFVLFREADLPKVPRSSVFRFLRDGVRGRVPLVVTGEPAWAKEIGADGAHLEGVKTTIAEARGILGPQAWVGSTVTTREEAAAAEGADYVLVNLDWSDPHGGVRTVQSYIQAAAAPVLIGPDVPPEQAEACIAAGAAGIGIIHAAMAAYDRTGSVRRYAEAIGRAHLSTNMRK